MMNDEVGGSQETALAEAQVWRLALDKTCAR